MARDHNGQSAVTVTTDLELGGRIAQFGSGVISQVSNRILAQFASRLNALIAGPVGTAESSMRHTPTTALRTARVPAAEDGVVLALTALAGIVLGLALGRTAQRLVGSNGNRRN